MKDSGYRFSKRSLKNMRGVRPELIAVATLALTRSEIDFGITEGLRTKERQRKLVASGASQTMRSRHLTGHALDVVAYIDGKVRWDWPLYQKIADAMLDAADRLRIDLEWGGHWTSLKNGPHFQLGMESYPA